MEFLTLGYGTDDEIEDKIPHGEWVVICDEHAAEAGMPDCYFAAKGIKKDVITEYENSGGTASYCWVVKK